MTEIVENQAAELDQDSKNLALLMWLGTLVFGFIPGLIFYLVKKDDEFIVSHSKEALNWSITAMIAYVIAMLLTFIVISVFLMPIIGICHLIFCIMGAVKASNAKEFRAPLNIRLIR